jgi:hypothetical protein
MKFLLLILTLCTFGSLLQAELPPTLKPLTDKFESNYAALTTASEAQLAPIRERYLAALAAAQKTATAASRSADLTAIAAEIVGVRAGNLAETFPPDLPRELAQDRRNYVTVVASNARLLPGKQRDLAAQYLQALAAVDAAAKRDKDAALTDAVAGEKARVLALLEAVGGGEKNHNVVANGDFSQGQPGAMPPGWKIEFDDINVTDAAIVTEGADKFLRFRRLQATRRANLVPEKEINIPAKTKWVELSVRMRVKGLVAGKDFDTIPGVHVVARDARGEAVGGAWAAAKLDTSWKHFSARFELAPTAKTLRVVVGPHDAAGVIDFDDVVVEFK